MTTAPRHHDRSPKTYTAGTGRPSARELDQTKVVRTVNVTGSVWEAGKKRAGEDKVSISHAIGLLLEAYSARVIDLDGIVAQLDALHAEDGGAGR
ncbi:hypothetical protein ACF065_35310 [Streptomyces sp. NPDC015232]|uniref:hypothetical protein n=1 Tax=unclassified Streptomyces TaxID=2593676 RepID=UPI003702C5A7